MSDELFKKIEKGLIISIILSILVYGVLIIISDLNKIIDAVKQVGIAILILLLTLSVLNYVFRFLRWHLMLKNAKIRISLKDSLKSFLAGLCLTITPGKAGELFKASFVKDFTDVSRLKVVPIVILERVFDLVGFAGILLVSLLFFSSQYLAHSIIIVSIVFAFFFAFFFFLKTKYVKLLLNFLTKKFAFLAKRKELLFEVLKDYSSISIVKIIALLLISFIGWFFETIELYILLVTFGSNVSIFQAGFVYGLSSLAGLLTLTPGGIIGFEASSQILLSTILGVSASIATVITLIIRLTTLWFAVLIGIVTYMKFFKTPNVR